MKKPQKGIKKAFGLAALLAAMAFLFAVNQAKATIIPATGDCSPVMFCADPYYGEVRVGGATLYDLMAFNASGTAPGFLAAPAGRAYWIAPRGDVQAGGSGVQDWGVTFTTSANSGPINISGTVAALGAVAVAVDGLGAYLGSESLTVLGSFSINVQPSSGTTHTLDFVFTGCNAYPTCNGSNEPVAGLLVDPSLSPAAAGATLNTVTEAAMLADGGVNPVPLPASVWLMLSGLVGVGVMARKRRDIAA